jgi:hypothetical protein
MKLLSIIPTVAICTLLSACGGAPASNEIRIDNDGNGRFSGSAGVGVTDIEIKSFVDCGPNLAVTTFSRRALSGSTIFNGQCG